MRSAPVPDDHETSEFEVPAETTHAPAGLARRVGAFLLHELREILPPTIFFFIGFNLIVLTTNLLLTDYGAQFGSFMLATAAALIVGKAVLVANAMRSLRHYDRAPLIRPILYKSVFYWAIVFVARLLEHWIRFWLVEHHPLGTFLPHMAATFDWDGFIAIQLWIFVLFLIYETATELNHLFGEGELWHLLVTSRPSELPLNGVAARFVQNRTLRQISERLNVLVGWFGGKGGDRFGQPLDRPGCMPGWLPPRPRS